MEQMSKSFKGIGMSLYPSVFKFLEGPWKDCGYNHSICAKAKRSPRLGLGESVDQYHFLVAVKNREAREGPGILRAPKRAPDTPFYPKAFPQH